MGTVKFAELELIDTCWNVNTLCSTTSMEATLELIDTCWNVNMSRGRKVKIKDKELIDTCWNVNLLHFVHARGLSRN